MRHNSGRAGFGNLLGLAGRSGVGRLLAGGLTLALLTGWLTGLGQAQDKTQGAAKGKVTLQVASWEETQAKIAAHKGKIVVLDAWSTSCPPCMKEFPNLVKLHRKYPKDVACLSFSCDYAGIKNKPPEFYRERVQTFLEKQEATFENLLASIEAEEVFEKLKIASIPAVLVYGRDGKLVKCFNNDQAPTEEEGFTYADVNKLVEELLAK
ncbi:MAG: TlpA family protein disulfide reductase [Planctomycetaceae bacterium]